MMTPSAVTPANQVGLRIAVSVGGALALILVLLAIVRPEMMGMASVAKLMGIGWWPS